MIFKGDLESDVDFFLLAFLTSTFMNSLQQNRLVWSAVTTCPAFKCPIKAEHELIYCSGCSWVVNLDLHLCLFTLEKRCFVDRDDALTSCSSKAAESANVWWGRILRHWQVLNLRMHGLVDKEHSWSSELRYLGAFRGPVLRMHRCNLGSQDVLYA